MAERRIPSSEHHIHKHPLYDPVDPCSEGDRLFIDLIAGGMAGALSKTMIAPLEITKINFQVSHEVYTTRKAFEFMIHNYKIYGFFGLFRGNTATLIRIIPYAAIQFAAHERWREILKIERGHMDAWKEFAAGSLAGLTSATVTYPLDVVRARIAVHPVTMGYTLRKAFVNIFTKEGISALFRGYVPTMLGVIPYAGARFGTYEILKKYYYMWSEEDHLNPIARLIFGMIAGLCGQTSSYPLDVVRRRMQTTDNREGTYNSVWGSVAKIYNEEGIRYGLFKGLTMNWIKGPIAVGVSFLTFDIMQTTLHKVCPVR